MAQNKPFIGTLTKLSDVVPLASPYGLTISIGNTCDFACIYCKPQVHETKVTPHYFTLAQMEELTRQLSHFPQPLRQISFVSQGETLLNPHLPEMIAMLKHAKVVESVKIITNANKLTSDLSDRLLAAGLDLLKISLQGLSTEKYRQICRPSRNFDFSTFVEQIRYFYKHRGTCQVHIKVIDIALDPGEETLFYEMFEAMADNLFVEHYISSNQKDENSNKFGIDVSQMEICPMPFYALMVDTKGNVLPCCLTNVEHAKGNCILGNVWQNPLKEIWDTRFCSVQKQLLCGTVDESFVCHQCTIFKSFEKKENELNAKKAEILKRYEGLL